jgi:hypothetical protein
LRCLYQQDSYEQLLLNETKNYCSLPKAIFNDLVTRTYVMALKKKIKVKPKSSKAMKASEKKKTMEIVQKLPKR